MKGINHQYIILQQKKLKVFLNAGSEPWEAPIGHKWYQIDVWLESLFASWIFDFGYLGYTGDITSYLANRYNKNITPVHVQHFIEYFKTSHKIEQLDDCSLKDVFLLGDDVDGCPVPIYKYDCAITKGDEQMLLKKLQDNPTMAKETLEDFFTMHMIRFNQSYYPKWGTGMEAKYLAEIFLTMHGIRLANQIKNRKSHWYNSPFIILLGTLAVIVVLAVIGWQMLKSDSFFVGFIGYMLIFSPTLLLLDKLGIINVTNKKT